MRRGCVAHAHRLYLVTPTPLTTMPPVMPAMKSSGVTHLCKRSAGLGHVCMTRRNNYAARFRLPVCYGARVFANQ